MVGGLKSPGAGSMVAALKTSLNASNDVSD